MMKNTIVCLLAAFLCCGTAKAQSRSKAADIVKLGGSLSFITSKTYIYNPIRGGMDVKRWQPGVSGIVEYEHVWPSGWGFGMTFDYDHTSFTGSYSSFSYDVNLLYWGLGGVYRYRFSDRWQLEAALGLGWAYVSGDVDQVTSGLGIMEKVGVEYWLSSHVGLGVELNDIMSFFPQPKSYRDLQCTMPGEFDEAYGFYRMELTAGLRIRL